MSDARPDPDPGGSPINPSGPARSDRSADTAGDRSIVEAVLRGDRDAFRVLVDRESAPVVRACHRVLGDLHDAEDAAQEAFVIAYRSLASWRGEGPFGAWLTRIAVRVALRKAGQRRTVAWRDPFGRDEAASADPITKAMDQVSLEAAPMTDPSSLALRGERATDVRTALAGLPEPYREVVTLRFFGEMSLDEIAVQTGRPLGTVKTHLHRGLIRLRSSLVDGPER